MAAAGQSLVGGNLISKVSISATDNKLSLRASHLITNPRHNSLFQLLLVLRIDVLVDAIARHNEGSGELGHSVGGLDSDNSSVQDVGMAHQKAFKLCRCDYERRK